MSIKGLWCCCTCSITRGLLAMNGCIADEPNGSPWWPPVMNGVEGVLGVAIYRPWHFGHRPGSSPSAEAGLADGPPFPPRRGWYLYCGYWRWCRAFSSSARRFQ